MSSLQIQPFFSVFQESTFQGKTFPEELFLEVLSSLTPFALINCRFVCKEWERITKKPKLWRQIAEKLGLSFPPHVEFELKVRCYFAIRAFNLNERLFSIAIAQQGKLLGKRGVCTVSDIPLQPLMPFPPQTLISAQHYFVSPQDCERYFNMDQFNKLVAKLIQRKMLAQIEGEPNVATLQPGDLDAFVASLKSLPLSTRITIIYNKFLRFFTS